MVTVEELLYSNYIKYDRLDKMSSLFQPGSFMDIYIDVYSMIKGLYNKEVKIVTPTIITSAIINICAHYRYYFTGKNIDTTFYIVNSKNISELNKKLCPNYNSKIEFAYEADKRMEELIYSNVELLKVICPYLTDIHFINSDSAYETGAIMDHIMNKVNPNNMRYNVVITRDLYNYQLCSRVNTFILRPYKTKDGDNSYVINRENLMKIVLWERKSSIKKTYINSELLYVLLALSNVPERNIKSLLNLNSAVKVLERALDTMRLVNEYNFYTNSIWMAINDVQQIANVGETVIDHRLKAIDIAFQSSVYSNTMEAQLLKFENLYDPETVMRINEKYFVNNPLDLEAL